MKYVFSLSKRGKCMLQITKILTDFSIRISLVPRADTIPIKYQKIKTTNITVYQYITFYYLCQYNPYFPIYSQSLSLFCPPNKI